MAGNALSLVDRVILPVRILFGGLFIYTSVNHALHATKLLEGI